MLLCYNISHIIILCQLHNGIIEKPGQQPDTTSHELTLNFIATNYKRTLCMHDFYY